MLSTQGVAQHQLRAAHSTSSVNGVGWCRSGGLAPASVRSPCHRRRRTAAAATSEVDEGSAPTAVVELSRGQVLRGALIAVGGALAAGAVPAAPAVAAEPAVASLAEPVVAAAGAAAAQTFSKVLLSTLADCQLAVSVYPTFSYNAAGGGGTGAIQPGEGGLMRLTFDPSTLEIPPINYQHASILGIPVPPPLNIAIVPKRLEGTLDPATGRIELDFLASFEFTAGPLYRAAPLTVATTLTTEESVGVLRSGNGQRMAADGRARMVGVARVPTTEDALVNTFLMLPTDALAVLSAELKFS